MDVAEAAKLIIWAVSPENSFTTGAVSTCPADAPPIEYQAPANTSGVGRLPETLAGRFKLDDHDLVPRAKPHAWPPAPDARRHIQR